MWEPHRGGERKTETAKKEEDQKQKAGINDNQEDGKAAWSRIPDVREGENERKSVEGRKQKEGATERNIR